ncbi:MAG TPA: hypothetical protein VL200_04975 [Lacunisphaera sp.]|nr:hypothetical protein [Lacunisphaera sp.]
MPEAFPVDPPLEIIQPCSEACVCFQPMPDGGWSDYGLCTNPASPLRGFPVRVGRDCRNYRTGREADQRDRTAT